MAHLGNPEEASTTCPTESYECELCRDIEMIEIEPRKFVWCKCHAVKRARRRLERSGLQYAIDTLTFERYRADAPWQQDALATVKAWVSATIAGDPGIRPWLFMGGSVGSGKTHLCTAACGDILLAGHDVRYVLWRETARSLKANINDPEEYERIMDPLKTVDVLYIDDLFKTQRERVQTNHRGEAYRPTVQERVSEAETRIAFELLDARYRMNRPTVISCEWLMDELMQIDDGVASRIYERSNGYRVGIGRADGRNMRLNGGVA